MPTTAANTYGNNGLTPIYDHNQKAEEHHLKLGNSLTLAKGTVLGQITATGLWIAYLSGAVDGSQIPKAILAYDTVTDGSGNHTIGGGQQGETYLTTPAFFSGDFKTTELTGLDANAITAGNWTLRWGSVSDGVVNLPG